MMRIATAILLQVVLTGPVSAQLAPVASHAAPANAPPAVVARVNGVAIGSGDLDAALDAILPLTSYHQNVSPEKRQELRTRALDGLIDEELRYQEAVRLKLKVSPREVEQALERARKAYRSRQQFDRARRASGATMPQLRASILRALMIGKVYEQAVGRSCRVSEDDAAGYYRENTARFVLPEQLRTSVITIGVEPSAPKSEWDEARRKADDLRKQIAAGASFEALAREHSTDPSGPKGGDLGWLHRGQLIDQFEQALSGLHPGDVSGVVQTIYGYHLLRLIEIRPAAQKTFDEVKASLVKDLTESRCSRASEDWTKRLRTTARIEIVGPPAAEGRAAR